MKIFLLVSLLTLTTFALETPAFHDGDTCFSPDEPCDVKLTEFIRRAHTSIEVAIYDINLDQVAHQLILAAKRIPVRIVVDKRQAKGSHSLVPMLGKAGLQIRYGRQRGIMHDKFTIVDGARMETGSFNYTNHASRANQENQLYLSNPDIVKRYRARFEEIWRSAAPIQPELAKGRKLWPPSTRENRREIRGTATTK